MCVYQETAVTDIMIHGFDLLHVTQCGLQARAPGKYEQQTAQRIPLVSGGLTHGKTKKTISPISIRHHSTQFLQTFNNTIDIYSL